MGISALPNELLHLLITYCARDELKTCRLVNKALHVVATPLLFDTAHLSPSTRSFARARHVASSSGLSILVRNVIYHVGILDEHEHGGYSYFREWTTKLKAPQGSTEEQTAEVLWRYNCLLEESDAQLAFQSKDEYEELELICQNFTNLESITVVLDGHDDPFAVPTDYVGQRTGWRSSEAAEGDCFSDLYKAVSGDKLRRIHALYTSWSCLARIHADLPEGFESAMLEDMRLCLFNSEYDTLDSEPKAHANSALNAVLTFSTNAKTLSLDFDEVPNDLSDGALLPICLSVFSKTWPRLQSLELMGLTVMEDELVEFLHRHRRTLRQLHLDDIFVIGLRPKESEEEQIRPGSVISLFQKLRDVLSVERMTLTGNFTNEIDEHFWVDTTQQPPGCIVLALQEWLSGRGTCPIPQDVLEMACHPRRFPMHLETDTELETEGDNDPDAMEVFQDWNDYSWAWSPE